MKNARFWIWWNDSWVKLVLRPGQQINLVTGGATEEGYSVTRCNYELCDGVVFRNIDTDAKDCDGRSNHYQEDACEIEHLMDIMMFADFPYPENNFIFRPDWQEVSISQRDFAAERAGY